jgi:hypothetical protein
MSSQSDIESGVTIKAALQPLQDKVDVLEETVCPQGEPQRTLHATMERVDMAQQGQGVSRPLHQARWHAGDGEKD